MSWLKKRNQNNIPSVGQQAEQVPMFNPNQWQPNNWYPQHQTSTQHQNYWEQPEHTDQQNQQSSQSTQFQQQYHAQNMVYNPLQPHPNQQTYGNLQYSQQYNTQNNSFQSVPLQNNETDSWGNWGWGDEDNSNLQSTQSKHLKPSNDLASNFTNEESWNWSVDDPNSQRKDQNFEDDIPSKDTNELFPKMGKQVKIDTQDQDNVSELAITHPVVPISKRNKLETPQWSMDSQISQESSDDILQTSESDNHLVSSSTVSHSPLSGLDSLQPMKEDVILESAPPSVYQHNENREIIKNNSSPSLNQVQQAPQAFSLISSSASGFPQDDASNMYKRTSQKVNQFSLRQNAYQQTFSQGVNLETVPDNCEHPDVPLTSTGKSLLMPNIQRAPNHHQNWQDNNEVPMNDRNQYLETGQLSDSKTLNFPSETEPAEHRPIQEDALPPPGLRRMVLGQMEQQETAGNSENCNDEPPPGLSRMVLGQNENNTNNTTVVENNANNSFEPISPPEGLRRMIPGESSSPENSLRQPTFQSETTRIDDSDREFRGVPQLRSATIGADTPPASTVPIASQTSLSTTNRSETIGGDDSGEKIKASNVSPASGRKMSRKTKEKKFDNQRRDFIEGQQLDSEVASMTSGVRNLTVGDNSTDDGNEANSKPEPRRKLSRQDTSESENDKRSGKSPRDKKDRRYKSDKRERDHYSPEPSKDRRYDRRKYRDRHYDDNVDYLSDRDHDKDNKDRDHEKKYYSLRKDKEKDRRRRESPREYERNNRRKREEYYHRYDDSYVEDRSRPSSRSDSMHDSMYRGSKRGDNDGRDRRRDRDKHRRIRDPYNPYSQGYSGFDPYSYQQYQYQYYENLRRTNPQAYAEIYRKYYDPHSSRHPPVFGADDRSSVHSGRSSANDDLKDSFSRSKDQTDYLLEDTVKSGRVTPAKFITSHTKASIGSGRLVKVLPNYPQDGQLALVEMTPLEVYLQKDDEFKELSSYPGPLIKDVTHKKTVIEYCENKIRSVNSNFEISDPESYVLLWEFLILLLRQNGKVVGTDIAELLLKKRTDNLPVRPPSVLSNLSGTTGDIPPISESSNPQLSEGGFANSLSNFKEEEITNKFREYLLYGSGQEALEWAMKHGLWGHALFLASKLGKRTYSNVMVRFANGLTLNDPLQTLYQLLSGRIPAVVSGVADEKWGDWRPHLAMMLSNSSLQPELNRKAIMSLGDTLMSRGSLYAAQFCYLMAEVDFGRYGAENVKMVLLGSSHTKPFLHFATNEAIHMTEIYEYACSLNDPEFTMPELQVYKYLLATRLADRGLLEKSLAYLEKISLYIINNPSNVQSSLVNNVCNLADRLKYYDPNGVEDDEDNDTTLDQRLDHSWLKQLKTVQEKVSCGLIPTLDNYNDRTLVETVDSNMYGSTVDQSTQEAWQQSNFYGGQYQNDTSQLPWQTEQQPQLDPSMELYQQTEQQQIEGYSSVSYQEQQPQQYWSAPQQPWETNVNQPNPEHLDQDQSNYYEQLNTQNEDEPRQQITIPNQSKGKSIFDDDPLPHEKKEQSKKSPSDTDIPQKKKSSGWFGGIFSKLALKPKNQMKLPDDKNPSIVWDQEKKRWVNVDEDNNVASSDLKPPPKISDMKTATATKPPQPPQLNSNNSLPQGYSNTPDSFNGNVNNTPQPPIENSQPPGFAGQDNAPPQHQGNMFKLQKNRNLKKSYIDVFNPGGATKQTISTPSLAAFSTPNTSQMNFFVPQLVDDPNAPTNFLTQATPVIQLSHDDSTQGRR